MNLTVTLHDQVLSVAQRHMIKFVATDGNVARGVVLTCREVQYHRRGEGPGVLFLVCLGATFCFRCHKGMPCFVSSDSLRVKLYRMCILQCIDRVNNVSPVGFKGLEIGK